jgi:hypothetical protein
VTQLGRRTCSVFRHGKAAVAISHPQRAASSQGTALSLLATPGPIISMATPTKMSESSQILQGRLPSLATTLLAQQGECHTPLVPANSDAVAGSHRVKTRPQLIVETLD